MSPLRVVVTGRHGQLARSLLEVGSARGVDVVAVGRPELELTDPATIGAAIAARKPDVVVNAAGYTDTEQAEVEPELAHAINVDGAAAVACAAHSLGVPLVHLSSAYVFDGASPSAYREDDPMHPLGAYGRTKALGEAAVATAHPDHVILRTSLVFSPFGRNTLTNLLRRAVDRDTLQVVEDQRVNPTSALDLADAILTVTENLARRRYDRVLYGVFHLAGRGATSPADFIEALLAHSAEYGGPSARVIRIASADLVSRVQRPLNALLDCARAAAVHGVTLSSWEAPLRHSVERYLARP